MTKTYAQKYERSQETFLYDNLFTCYLGVFDVFYLAKHLVYTLDSDLDFYHVSFFSALISFNESSER